jgi:hypothetical protein
MGTDDPDAAPTPREPRTRTDALKRLTIAVLLATALATASSAQAAQHRTLTVKQAEVAIERFATKLGKEVAYEEDLETSEPVSLANVEVTRCRVYRRGGSCHVVWEYSNQVECTAIVAALPAPMRVVGLTLSRCRTRSNEEFDLSPHT